MIRFYSFLFVACSFIVSCSRSEVVPVVVVDCQPQTANPAGRSYATDDIVGYTCTEKQCGMMPMSASNYWIYLDSVYVNGSFSKTVIDTLSFSSSKSLTDGLTWWHGDKTVGLPATFYSNDSAFFSIENRAFLPGTFDVNKDFRMPAADTARYLSNFADAAAAAMSVRLKNPVFTANAVYNDCILFEKNARFFQKDQVWFKPGIGVIRYTREKANPGSPTLKLQIVSTLISSHIN